MKWIVSVALNTAVCMLSCAGDSIDVLLDRLEGGDDSVLTTLMEKRELVLAKLCGRRPSDAQIQTWLKHLGDAAFSKRREASKNLLAAGSIITPEVEKHLSMTNDPEVTMRCKELLKAFAKQNEKALRKPTKQLVKLLIRFPDLPAVIIKKFAFGYEECLKDVDIDSDTELEFASPGDDTPSVNLEILLDHYAQLPGAAKTLSKYALKCEAPSVYEYFADAALKADRKVAIPLLLVECENLNYLLGLIGKHLHRFSEKELDGLVNRLLAIDPEQLRLDPSTYWVMEEHLAKHAIRLLNAHHPNWQALGLAAYEGDWKAIRPKVEAMIDEANPELSEVLSFLNPPNDAFPWLLAKLVETKELHLGKKTILRLSKTAKKLPKKAILERIGTPGHDGDRLAWCDALLVANPKLRDTMAKKLSAVMGETEAPDEFTTLLVYLRDRLDTTFEVGHFDERWQKQVALHKRSGPFFAEIPMRYVKLWKVSPKLALAHLKTLNLNVLNRYRAPDIAYMCTAGPKETDDAVVDFVLDNIKREVEFCMHPLILRAVIAIRPTEAVSLLERKARWFDTASDSSLVLMDCMVPGPGSYGYESCKDIRSLVLSTRPQLLEKLKTIRPDDPTFTTWFPYVCILAAHQETASKHAGLLAKRLQQMIPLLTKPRQFIAAVCASATIDYPKALIEPLLLKLADEAPQSPELDYLNLLTGRYAAIVPKLVRLSEKENSLNPLRMAMKIAPDDKRALQRLRRIALESPDKKMVEDAIFLLSPREMPPAKAFDERHLRWIMWTACFERKEDKRAQLQAILPTLRWELATKDLFFLSFPVELEGDSACQKLIIPHLLSMLDSRHVKVRIAATRILRECVDELGPHLKRLHQILKHERNPNVRWSLVETIAKLGKDASFMVDTIRALDDQAVTQWYCLAKISPDTVERKTYLRKLLKDFENVDYVDDFTEFPELTKPFRKRLLDATLNGKEIDEIGPDSSVVPIFESVRQLGEPPSDENLAKLRMILKAPLKNASHVSAALYTLRKYYPNRLEECRDVIESLPLGFKMNSSYWRIARRLRTTL